MSMRTESHVGGLKFSPSLCMKWSVDARDKSTVFTSSDFRFQGEKCRLIFNFHQDEYILRLHSFSGVRLNKSFDAVVCLENGSGQLLSGLKKQTHLEVAPFPPIWRRKETDVIARGCPGFGLSNYVFRFRVLLTADAFDKSEECSCAMCQFNSADDNILSLDSFSKNLGDLLDQDASADVEFRCVDADGNILTTVKAHKCVLCVRSPVLASMLHSDMVEGRTGVATIRDIDADVFKQFLKYLYSGKLNKTTMDAAMSLYEAGDRFQVKSLTKHSALRIVRNLTIEKSCEVLLFADAHCDEELAEATVIFMVNRKVPHMFHGWDDFCSKHPVLSTRVLNRFCKMFKGMSPKGESSCSKRRRIM